jgi:phage host-nuclease inhibitor protein Gam
MLDDFAQYAEHRNFMVHAIMVPANSKDIAFKMYDHREGIYSVGDLHFEMTHLEALATQIAAVSIEFTSFVAKMCSEIPLPEV